MKETVSNMPDAPKTPPKMASEKMLRAWASRGDAAGDNEGEEDEQDDDDEGEKAGQKLDVEPEDDDESDEEVGWRKAGPAELETGMRTGPTGAGTAQTTGSVYDGNGEKKGPTDDASRGLPPERSSKGASGQRPRKPSGELRIASSSLDSSAPPPKPLWRPRHPSSRAWRRSN